MNGLIRKRATWEYLRSDGTWTHHPGQAASYNGVLDAVAAVQHFSLQGVDFVYLMGGDAAYDMVYELTDCQGTVPAHKTGSSVAAPS